MDEQVHAAQAVGEVLRLLAVEGQVPAVLGEQVGLHKHAARAAAGIEDDATRWLQHGHQHADDADRCEVLAAALPLGRGELADEVLVNPADQVIAAMILLENVFGEQADQAADVLDVEV